MQTISKSDWLCLMRPRWAGSTTWCLLVYWGIMVTLRLTQSVSDTLLHSVTTGSNLLWNLIWMRKQLQRMSASFQESTDVWVYVIYEDNKITIFLICCMTSVNMLQMFLRNHSHLILSTLLNLRQGQGLKCTNVSVFCGDRHKNSTKLISYFCLNTFACCNTLKPCIVFVQIKLNCFHLLCKGLKRQAAPSAEIKQAGRQAVCLWLEWGLGRWGWYVCLWEERVPHMLRGLH